MKLIAAFLGRYPLKSMYTLVAMLFAGLAEGVGMSMLLPLLSMSIDEGGNISAPGTITRPSSLERIVDSLFAFINIDPTIGVLLIFFVVSIVVKAGLVLIANRQVGYMVAQVATDLRLSLVRAVFASRWEYFVNQSTGALSNAFATEAQRSASAYLFGMRIIALLLNAVVYVAVAVMVSWEATLAALGAGVFLLYILRQLVRYAKMAGRQQTEQLKNLLSVITDVLHSIKPLKAMAREGTARVMLEHETNNLNASLRQQVFSKEALKALQEPVLTIFFAFGLYVALAGLGLSVSSVLVMVYMLAKIMKTLQRAQREHQSMVIAESAYWSMCRRIDDAREHCEKNTGLKNPGFEQEIKLDHVSFSYGERRVLQDVSMIFPKGTFTAITGPSGVGKTTVVDMITGMLVPDSGHVLIDNVSIGDIDLLRWRKMIGYVPQETLLLHDTVFFNVTLGDDSFSEEDVKIALQKAGMWEFVSGLPDGMHTLTGERGCRLSGGQRQRITIARALVHRPELLILDEATSSLDPESGKDICETLASLSGEITIIAISHNDFLIEAAHRVYRMGKDIVLI